jgi:hypothetical protein
MISWNFILYLYVIFPHLKFLSSWIYPTGTPLLCISSGKYKLGPALLYSNHSNGSGMPGAKSLKLGRNLGVLNIPTYIRAVALPPRTTPRVLVEP